MGKRILLIDDSVTFRHQISVCLRGGGYEVVEAVDGLDALGKRDGCDLAICDVNMPRMNGIEFVEQVGRQAMPVVMLTTEGRPELIERARKAGARGWMVKPFQPEQLLSVVKQLVG
jgi:two-component system, chemotaxis family, chemotaxis protein CheY